MRHAGQGSACGGYSKGGRERAADLVHLGEGVEETWCSAGVTLERLIGINVKKPQEGRQAGTSSCSAPHEYIRHPHPLHALSLDHQEPNGSLYSTRLSFLSNRFPSVLSQLQKSGAE